MSLDNVPLKVGEEELTLGKAISNILVSDESGGKMKLWILAQKFYKEEEMDLDSSDFVLVKTAVQKSKIYTVLVLGQIEMILSKIEND